MPVGRNKLKARGEDSGLRWKRIKERSVSGGRKERMRCSSLVYLAKKKVCGMMAQQ